MDRSARFYTGMLNMDIIGRTDHYIQLRSEGKHDSLFLFKADGPVNPRACGLTHMHFGFRIDDKAFDRVMDYIKRNNIKIHPNPDRPPGRYVYIEDPDGYVVQLDPGECD